MKRICYIVYTVILLIISACSQIMLDSVSQAQESSRSHIFFESELVESIETKTGITRISLADLDNPDSFGVMGYYEGSPLFVHNDYKFTSEQRGTGWIAEVYLENGYFTYDHLDFWQSTGKSHDFYAFYPYSSLANSICIESAETTNKGTPYILYDISNDPVDILTDNKSLKKTEQTNNLVTFDLAHRLWALEIQVINNQETNIYEPNSSVSQPRAPKLYIKTAYLTISDGVKSGKIYLNGNFVQVDTIEDEFDFTLKGDGDPIEVTNTKTNNLNVYKFAPVLLLPASTLTYELTIEFQNAWGVDYAEPFVYKGTVNKQFLAGNKYKLAVQKNDGQQFTISQLQPTAWSTQSITHEFN